MNVSRETSIADLLSQIANNLNIEKGVLDLNLSFSGLTPSAVAVLLLTIYRLSAKPMLVLSESATASERFYTLCYNLMPRSLTDKGLVTAITDLAVRFSSKKLEIATQFFGLDDRLSHFVEFNVYRIVQEAINNIIKHAKASKVLIDFNLNEGLLNVSIEDNGIGFRTENMDSIEGLGLQNILNRAKMMNGNSTISSQPNDGALIEIQIPLKSHG